MNCCNLYVFVALLALVLTDSSFAQDQPQTSARPYALELLRRAEEIATLEVSTIYAMARGNAKLGEIDHAIELARRLEMYGATHENFLSDLAIESVRFKGPKGSSEAFRLIDDYFEKRKSVDAGFQHVMLKFGCLRLPIEAAHKEGNVSDLEEMLALIGGPSSARDRVLVQFLSGLIYKNEHLVQMNWLVDSIQDKRYQALTKFQIATALLATNQPEDAAKFAVDDLEEVLEAPVVNLPQLTFRSCTDSDLRRMQGELDAARAYQKLYATMDAGFDKTDLSLCLLKATRDQKRQLISKLFEIGEHGLAIDAGIDVSKEFKDHGVAFIDPFNCDAPQTYQGILESNPLLVWVKGLVVQGDFEEATKIVDRFETDSDRLFGRLEITRGLVLKNDPSAKRQLQSLHRMQADLKLRESNYWAHEQAFRRSLVELELANGFENVAFMGLKDVEGSDKALMTADVAFTLIKYDQTELACSILDSTGGQTEEAKRIMFSSVGERLSKSMELGKAIAFAKRYRPEGAQVAIGVAAGKAGKTDEAMDILEHISDSPKQYSLANRLFQDARKRDDREMIDRISNFVIKTPPASWETMYLLASCKHFQQSLDFCVKDGIIEGNVHVLSFHMADENAPVEFVAKCWKALEKESRIRWCLEDCGRHLGAMKKVDDIESLTKVASDQFSKSAQALFMCNAAIGLSRHD